MELDSFRSLLRRVRAGDAQAAGELVRAYEPSLRRQVRMQLTDPHLRRYMDSVDVCQSVLGKFFFRVAAGDYDLESPGQLLSLLSTMARNRIRNHVRDQRTTVNDARRNLLNGEDALAAVTDRGSGPSQIVEEAELLSRALAEMTDEERLLFEQRADKMPWEEIARRHGKSEEAVRKTLSRAVERISRLFGLEED